MNEEMKLMKVIMKTKMKIEEMKKMKMKAENNEIYNDEEMKTSL